MFVNSCFGCGKNEEDCDKTCFDKFKKVSTLPLVHKKLSNEILNNSKLTTWSNIVKYGKAYKCIAFFPEKGVYKLNISTQLKKISDVEPNYNILLSKLKVLEVSKNEFKKEDIFDLPFTLTTLTFNFYNFDFFSFEKILKNIIDPNCHDDRSLLDLFNSNLEVTKSIIGSRKNDSVSRLDTNKRRSNQFTFVQSNEIEYILGNLLRREFKKKYGDIEYDLKFSNHNDLILYTHGGIFKCHRDKIDPFVLGNPSFKQYSIIICLDSNLLLNTREGNTVVYYIDRETRISMINDSYYSNSFGYFSDYHGPKRTDDFNLTPHVFYDSCLKYRVLIFPSNAPHESLPIISKNGYKFIFKTDVFINFEDENKIITQLTESSNNEQKDFISDGSTSDNIVYYKRDVDFSKNDEIKDLYSKYQSCNCTLCDSYLYNELYYERLIENLLIHIFGKEYINFTYISKFIIEFIPSNNITECSKISCTCIDCYKSLTYYMQFSEDEYEDSYESDYDTDCNGYC